MRSVKSLDFDSDVGISKADVASRANGKLMSDRKMHDIDYTSEPVAEPRLRPMPPKKPLRLSLQRAQSLQTVDGANTAEQDRKRAMKRTHGKGKNSEMLQFIENNVPPFHTASLGRHNYV